MNYCDHHWKIIKTEEGLLNGIFLFSTAPQRVYTLQCSRCGNITCRTIPIPYTQNKDGEYIIHK